jgi:hypothetical protein
VPSLIAAVTETTAAHSWVRLGLGGAAVASLVLAGSALVTAAREPLISYAAILRRTASLVMSAGLLAATFVEPLPPWGVACAALAFVVTMQAVAISMGYLDRLRAYLDRTGDGDEPGWWPEFEAAFRRYSERPKRRWRTLLRSRRHDDDA